MFFNPRVLVKVLYPNFIRYLKIDFIMETLIHLQLYKLKNHLEVTGNSSVGRAMTCEPSGWRFDSMKWHVSIVTMATRCLQFTVQFNVELKVPVNTGLAESDRLTISLAWSALTYISDRITVYQHIPVVCCAKCVIQRKILHQW